MLNSSLIPHIKTFSLKGDGVVVFIHKSLNLKIIHDLSKSNGIVETVKRKKKRKGTLSGLRQFLGTASPLKMLKNAFYFTSKAFSFSRYLNFYLTWSCRDNFKISNDVTAWLTNNCNMHIAQYLEK